MSLAHATITAGVMEHADGRPVAYVDAIRVTVFAYQEPDGSYVIDICTRDDIPPGKLRMLLDGQPLAVPGPRARMPATGLGPRRIPCEQVT